MEAPASTPRWHRGAKEAGARHCAASKGVDGGRRQWRRHYFNRFGVVYWVPLIFIDAEQMK
jgi:hypothetical protein